MCFQEFIFVYFCALCLLLGYVQDLTSNFSDVLALTVFLYSHEYVMYLLRGPYVRFKSIL